MAGAKSYAPRYPSYEGDGLLAYRSNFASLGKVSLGQAPGFSRGVMTHELPWRKRQPNERTREYIPSEITLAEIYEYVKKNIPDRILITVFVNEPLKAPVYQCNNYTVGEWWKIGVLSGYA